MPARTPAQSGPPAKLAGQVVDSRTRLAIPRARITVTGLNDTLSADAGGRFVADTLRGGAHIVEVSAIGYGRTRWVVELAAGNLDATFALEPIIPQLDTVRVGTRQVVDPNDWRSPQSFERRRAQGLGRFVTAEQMRQSNARTLGELMRSVPGVLTTCINRQCRILLSGAFSAMRQCAPDFYLDGYPATYATGPDFPLARIQGVEIYDASRVPSEFAAPQSRCGVIAMWTLMTQ